MLKRLFVSMCFVRIFMYKERKDGRKEEREGEREGGSEEERREGKKAHPPKD